MFCILITQPRRRSIKEEEQASAAPAPTTGRRHPSLGLTQVIPPPPLSADQEEQAKRSLGLPLAVRDGNKRQPKLSRKVRPLVAFQGRSTRALTGQGGHWIRSG